jgi:hypothetical protein
MIYESLLPIQSGNRLCSLTGTLSEAGDERFFAAIRRHKTKSEAHPKTVKRFLKYFGCLQTSARSARTCFSNELYLFLLGEATGEKAVV